MGVASWRVWHLGGGPVPLGLYAAQLAMNMAWSPLFFKAHNLKAATIDITALIGVLAVTIIKFNEVDPLAAQLLIPYLGWTAFAAALTWNIYLNNPDVRTHRVIFVMLCASIIYFLCIRIPNQISTYPSTHTPACSKTSRRIPDDD